MSLQVVVFIQELQQLLEGLSMASWCGSTAPSAGNKRLRVGEGVGKAGQQESWEGWEHGGVGGWEAGPLGGLKASGEELAKR